MSQTFAHLPTPVPAARPARPLLAAAAALAALLLLAPWADANAAPRPPASLAAMASGQISFEGLDLSDDEPKPKKKRTQRKVKKPKRDSSRETARTPPGGKLEEKADDSSSQQQPPALPGLGIDLSGSSPAPTEQPKPTPPPAPPAPPPKQAPVMTFDAVDVSGKSAERQRLDAAVNLFKQKRYETAALAFFEVIKDPKMAELKDEADYMLAKTLYRMGMYHSALNEFKKLLAKGPSNKYFKSCLEWLFYIAHKTVNEQIVLDTVALYANEEFPERFRSEFRYLLARYHFYRGKALDEVGQAEEAKKSLDEAKRLVLMVPRDDAFYAKVKYLEGAIFFKEGAFAQALESFKEVVRINNPRTSPNADARLRELAFMQLARTHYGHKQNRYAIFYYDKVARGSDQWLESLFEASWAHFRIGEYERALGNLITLSSPFFKDEYFPEALILKAVIYYENCRYREARAILEEFEQTYMPVHNELEKITGANTDAQGYWAILAEVQKRNREGRRSTGLLLERILKLALTDKDLKAVNDSILELEAEMDSIRERPDLFKYSELAKALNEEMKVERSGLMSKAGILAKAKLEFELGQLKDLLGQALRIKFETSTMEKKFLEDSLASPGKVEVVKKYKYSVAVTDEQVYWPYEGEYWRDELGTYEYTLTKGCKAK
ncbi:MAG: adventurous gliding motility protein GltC [Myxococcales bacterium]